MEIRQVLKYFNNKNVYNAKQFDSACLNARNYAKENGFTKDQLEIISDYCLNQNLSSRRISNMIKMLIPETYVSDKVIRDVIKYMVSQKPGKVAVKLIYQWLVGLTEHKLTESDVIDRYYDLYFRQLNLDDPLAAKLIYLLTKPQDVKRWYVKKVLKLNETYRSKATGALLYLFKTYRPDFVPENIPAYAVQSVFPKLPADMLEGFAAARERIHAMSEVTVESDNICWERTDHYRKKAQNIILIPRTLVVDDNFNVNENISSLKKVRSLKQLHNYLLGHYSLENTYLMQLLNNPGGRLILAFADDKIHRTLSYMVYCILCDGFYNPKVHYDEMKYFLQCIASLQNELQQSIPIISTALADYMTTWNGDDHFEEITSLLEYVSFTSYENLYEQFLKPLRLIFITSNLYKKCNVLETFGNMILNFINLYSSEEDGVRWVMFSNERPKLNFLETLEKMMKFTMDICQLGLYLENNHCLMQSCILNLYEKIISSGINHSVQWNIPENILYSLLFSYSASNVMSLFSLAERCKCISERVKHDMNLLISKNSLFSKLRFLEDLPRNNKDLIPNLQMLKFNINTHLSFSSYYITYKVDKNISYGFMKTVQLYTTHLEENEPQKKKTKRLGG